MSLRTWRKHIKPTRLWASAWMQLAGTGFFGRLAARLAALPVRPYRGLYLLARLTPNGYMAPSAAVSHQNFSYGTHLFVGDRTIIFGAKGGGSINIDNDVHINQDCILETGQGGTIFVGEGSRIQPRCLLAAYKGSIHIGRDVLVAPGCAFYTYDHEFKIGKSIKQQPLVSKGGIVIGDDAWIGFGVIVLDGAKIGKGAIVGAGSLVRSTIPDRAIAVGNPARVIRYRETEPAVQ